MKHHQNQSLLDYVVAALTLCVSLLSGQTFAIETEQTFSPYKSDDANLVISGYLKLVAEHPLTEFLTDGKNDKLELDDLSFYLSAHMSKWVNPFVEAEYFGDQWWSNKDSFSVGNGNFIIERAYNDILLTDNTRLRVGKFLAPVGYWNLIHAAPLVWSTTRPQSTQYSYANYISGVEYGVTLDEDSGRRFDIYLQPNNEFDPKPLSSHPRHYQQVWGASFTVFDSLDARASIDYQQARVKNSPSVRRTLSLHFARYFQKIDIDGQFIYTDILDPVQEQQLSYLSSFDAPWDGGGYLQLRYRLSSQQHLYVGLESFHYGLYNQKSINKTAGIRFLFGNAGNINIEYNKESYTPIGQINRWSVAYNLMFSL